MAKCSKCGAKIPPQSRFCLACGAAVPEQSAPVQARPSGGAETSRRKVGAMAVVAALLIVALLVFLGLRMRGARLMAGLRPDTGGSPVLRAPTPVNPSSPSVLNAPNAADANRPSMLTPPAVGNPPQPGILNANGQTRPGVPADVVAYLDYLKRVDAYRISLQEADKTYLYRLLPSMLSGLRSLYGEAQDATIDDSDFDASKQKLSDRAVGDLDTLITQWRVFIESFNKVTPPQSCQALAWKYSDALGEVVLWSTDLLSKIKTQDMSIYALQKQSGRIDDKLEAADAELADVCRKHGIAKGFSIRSDRGQAPGLLTP